MAARIRPRLSAQSEAKVLSRTVARIFLARRDAAVASLPEMKLLLYFIFIAVPAEA
jgi:hypothetical protein